MTYQRKETLQWVCNPDRESVFKVIDMYSLISANPAESSIVVPNFGIRMFLLVDCIRWRMSFLRAWMPVSATRTDYIRKSY